MSIQPGPVCGGFTATPMGNGTEGKPVGRVMPWPYTRYAKPMHEESYSYRS